jgi:putative tricarboxylic transport membrane protein
MNTTRREALGLGAGLAALALPGVASAAAWKPEHAVELVAQSAPGGGTDVTARLIQHIIETHDLLEVPVNVVNKPGGSGNAALSYMNQHAGDAHYMQIASAAVLTSFINGNSEFNYADFSPIAQLNSEYIAFGVNADSDIKTGKDMMDALAKDPGSLSIAIGTARGGVNHVATAMIAEAAGADPKKLKAVVFKSSSESATALMGNHVDVAASSASILLPYVPDRIRLIGITSPKRLDGALADVPTWQEQGVDLDLNNFRMLLGAPGLTEDQVAFWADVIGKVMETDDWKKDLEANGWTNEVMSPAEFRAHLDRQFKALHDTLANIGMAAG